MSQAAQMMALSEQRIRQLFDAGLLSGELGPKGERFPRRESVEALVVERQVQQILTGARKRGPKGPRRSVSTTRAYRLEFEGATA